MWMPGMACCYDNKTSKIWLFRWFKSPINNCTIFIVDINWYWLYLRMIIKIISVFQNSITIIDNVLKKPFCHVYLELLYFSHKNWMIGPETDRRLVVFFKWKHL